MPGTLGPSLFHVAELVKGVTQLFYIDGVSLTVISFGWLSCQCHHGNLSGVGVKQLCFTQARKIKLPGTAVGRGAFPVYLKSKYLTQIKQGVSFIAANKVYTSTNKTTIV